MVRCIDYFRLFRQLLILGCDRVVTVLMALSSVVFYVLSNRVQLVSRNLYQNYLATYTDLSSRNV